MKIRPDGIWDPDGKYPNPLTGKPYSPNYKILSRGLPGKKGWTHLTAWEAKVDIIKQIDKHSILLLVLPTGVGKTVIVPKLLLHYFEYKKKVLVTTPRLITTSGAGEYSAACLDVPLTIKDVNGKDIRTNNKQVGYKYSDVSTEFGDKNSMLLFTTDGSVKNQIVKGDKDLSNYAGIIIDEAHERSTNIDILIALVMDIIPRRPDFKVIIMSATIDKNVFIDYFKRIGYGNKYGTFDLDNIPTNYKLDFEYTIKNIDKNSTKIVDTVYNKINEIILNPSLPIGNILAFVTSEPETGKIKKKIENNMSHYPINNKPFPIAFTAKSDDKIKNIAKNKNTLPQGYARKVIIATNAIESSVTFEDNLVYIIDTGLAFEKSYDAANYCYKAGKELVSQASIKQRCGRTGRNCNGICIKLYTNEKYKNLKEFGTPKIYVEDFTKVFLELCIIKENVANALKFMDKMIEQPSTYKENINVAGRNLLNMNLIDRAGNVTDLGVICNDFGTYDIKISKMIIAGYYLGCIQWSIMLGVILNKIQGLDDIFIKPFNMENDVILQKKYNDTVKSKIHPSGDHITLLQIFNDFINIPVPNRYKYSLDNFLDFKKLTSWQEDYEELKLLVTKNKNLIKNLNLFNVPVEKLILGGGKVSNELKSKTESDFDDESESDSDDETESDFDDEIHNIETENIKSNNIESNNIESEISKTQYGGTKDEKLSNSYDETDNISYDDDDETDDDETDDDDDFENFENKLELDNNISTIINNTINPSNIINSNSSNDTTTSRNYYNSYKGGVRNNNKNIKSNNRSCKYGGTALSKVSGKKTKLRRTFENGNENVISGGAIKHNEPIEITQKREKRQKIMNLLNISNINSNSKLYKLKPPKNIIDSVLASLYFGFSNNIACYTGKRSNYNVKFSPLTGSILSSAYDYIDKKPDFIVYNEFVVKTDMNKDNQVLSIVSEINSLHFSNFIDMDELIKQIKS